MALTGEEKTELARRIARGVQVVCSSIAQLHLGSPNPHLAPHEDETGIVTSLRQHGANKWKFTNIEGALLLTKDQAGVLHFRIYDLQQYKLRFQYELYEGMDYQKLDERVHAFEMENCMCGFSFSSHEVANKFFNRVQNYKPKSSRNRSQGQLYRQTNATQAASTGFNQVERSVRHIKKSNTAGSRSTNRSFQNQQDTSIYLGNGMLDPNNVPSEWKKILKKAGIKKRDLKNPKMFEIIKDTLTSHNIALDPPTDYDFDDPRLRQYYTPEQIQEWKRYKQEMEEYKKEEERYQRELAEWEKQQEKAMKLQALMNQQNQKRPNQGGMTAKEKLRQSVAVNYGAHMANMTQLQPAGAAKQMPRMSVARPAVPVLPVIPQEQKIANIVGSRVSRVVLKTNMLEGLKAGDIALRRVSVLPTIKNQSAGEQNGLLATLRKKLAENREALQIQDEGNDSGSEWEED